MAVADRVSLFRHVSRIEYKLDTRQIGSRNFFDLRESKASPTPSEYRFQSGSRSPVHREQGNPRSSSPLPAESSATALDVQLTEWTAYFASIACASHNWLSGQVTLPWFKSSDFAAAESSW